jgi:integrase
VEWTVTANPPKVSRALLIPKLDESANIRRGKFETDEAELIARYLPAYMTDVARMAFEVGSRKTELLTLRWSYIGNDGIIRVPVENTKNREVRKIAITQTLQQILDRRLADRHPDSDFIFHNGGHQIIDYRKCWQTVCVLLGFGNFECRDCKTVLDTERQCPKCGAKPERPKYVGRLFHDFRRSASHEMRKYGVPEADAMKVTGHKTSSMFKRYSDIFTDEEDRDLQLATQERRRQCRENERKSKFAVIANGKAVS